MYCDSGIKIWRSWMNQWNVWEHKPNQPSIIQSISIFLHMCILCAERRGVSRFSFFLVQCFQIFLPKRVIKLMTPDLFYEYFMVYSMHREHYNWKPVKVTNTERNNCREFVKKWLSPMTIESEISLNNVSIQFSVCIFHK